MFMRINSLYYLKLLFKVCTLLIFSAATLSHVTHYSNHIFRLNKFKHKAVICNRTGFIEMRVKNVSIEI